MMDKKEQTERSALRQAGRSIRKRMATYVAGGLGLVAALAWNDAMGSLIRHFFPSEANSIVAKLLYAVLITLLVGLLLYFVEKFQGEEKK